MTFSKIDNKITLGNALTVGTLLVALAGAYAGLSHQSAANARSIEDQEARIRVVEREIASRLATIEAELRIIRRSVE